MHASQPSNSAVGPSEWYETGKKRLWTTGFRLASQPSKNRVWLASQPSTACIAAQQDATFPQVRGHFSEALLALSFSFSTVRNFSARVAPNEPQALTSPTRRPAPKLMPVDACGSLSVMTGRRTANTQLALLDDIAAMDQSESPEIGYPPLFMAMHTIPGKRPADDLRIWRREQGKSGLVITAGTNLEDGSNIGLPYGPKARLLIAVFGAWAVKHRTPVIELGPSMAEFMRSLGLGTSGGKTGPRTLVGEQVKRLVRAQFEISFDGDDPGRDRGAGMRLARSWDVWWDRSDNSSHPVKGSYIELSHDFYQLIIDRSFPINVAALRILDSRGALAMDLFTYFTFRLPKLDRPLVLTWAQATEHFGKSGLPAAGRARTNAISETKRNILAALPYVLAVYHRAKVEVVASGLKLFPSTPHVPQRGMHGHARAAATATLPARRAAAMAADAGRTSAQALSQGG